MKVKLNGYFLKNFTTPLEDWGMSTQGAAGAALDSLLYCKPVPTGMMGMADSAFHMFWIDLALLLPHHSFFLPRCHFSLFTAVVHQPSFMEDLSQLTSFVPCHPCG